MESKHIHQKAIEEFLNKLGWDYEGKQNYYESGDFDYKGTIINIAVRRIR